MPEGITLYHVTNALTDLTASMRPDEDDVELTRFVFGNDIRKSIALNASGLDTMRTTEKRLVDVLVTALKAEEERTSSLITTTAHLDPELAAIEGMRNLYDVRHTVLVRKYEPNSRFPLREWGRRTIRERFAFAQAMGMGIAFSTGKVATFTEYDTAKLMTYAREHNACAIVLIDFSCKVPNYRGDDEDKDKDKRRHHLRSAAPEQHAAMLYQQYRNGKVIMIAGGSRRRSRIQQPRTRARSRRRRRRSSATTTKRKIAKAAS